jgi:hypothetical protein
MCNLKNSFIGCCHCSVCSLCSMLIHTSPLYSPGKAPSTTTSSNQKTKTNKLKALKQQPSQHNLNALDTFDPQPEAAPLANTGTGSDIRVMMALQLLVTGDDQWKDFNLW